jgi:two-component system, OmpR family, sensor histidine kinase CiaH
VRIIQSATFKLTLSYLAIIMVLSGLFSYALYRESYGQLAENADRQRIAVQRLPLPYTLEARRTQFLQDLADALADGQRRLVIRLLALNLGTLLVGGAASYALARRTLRPIQESLEAQGRFTADASHELRTPLTVMRSEIEVALREKQLDASEARKLLDSNLEEIAKLESLSAGLLRLARFENGVDSNSLESFPARELFEGAIDRHSKQLAARKIELDMQAGKETVAGDRASLTELVAILLDNAVKYSAAKSKILLRSVASPGAVTLVVQDHGAGINASDIPHIFERFYRADHSRARADEQVGGYGLGLSIAKRIADVHHAKISVESTPGKGTTFRVKLPMHQESKKRSLLGI